MAKRINIPNVTGNIVITAVTSAITGGVDPVDTTINGMTYMTYGKGINQTTAVITDNPQCWATVNAVQVVNGKTYTITLDAVHAWVFSFDDSDKFVSQLVIGNTTNPQTFTFTANTSHIRFGCYDPNHTLTYCRVSASGSSSGGSGGGGGTTPTPTPDPTPTPTPDPTPTPGTGSDLTGTYLFFGDSICRGGGANNYGYPEAIKAKQPSMKALNYSVSGTCIAKNDSYDAKYPSILSKIQGSTPYADYVVLEGGFNDSWGQRNPLGTLKSGSAPTTSDAIRSYSASLNAYQFTDALEKCICEIKLKYWGKKIFFVVPHTVNAATYANTYHSRAIEVCNKWGVKVIDLRNCGMPASQDGTYNVDGTHPSAAAYDKYYAPNIINVLKANK